MKDHCLGAREEAHRNQRTAKGLRSRKSRCMEKLEGVRLIPQSKCAPFPWSEMDSIPGKLELQFVGGGPVLLNMASPIHCGFEGSSPDFVTIITACWRMVTRLWADAEDVGPGTGWLGLFRDLHLREAEVMQETEARDRLTWQSISPSSQCPLGSQSPQLAWDGPLG
ncbi:hypothetical protein R6Z07F_017588 [Ovis aries]